MKQIIITLGDDNSVQVMAPMDDKMLCFKIIGAAIQAIADYNVEVKPDIVIPAFDVKKLKLC